MDRIVVPKSKSNRLSPREKTAVHSIDDWLSGDHPATEETAIETLDRVLAALDSVELQVDVTLRVGI